MNNKWLKAAGGVLSVCCALQFINFLWASVLWPLGWLSVNHVVAQGALLTIFVIGLHLVEAKMRSKK